MLSAAVEDFRRVAGVEVSTVVNAGPDEPAAFRAAAVEADYALVIAPEFDRILETALPLGRRGRGDAARPVAGGGGADGG